MLIKICGNCKTYKYENGVNHKGCCAERRHVCSPLSAACEKYNPKIR